MKSESHDPVFKAHDREKEKPPIKRKGGG